MSMENKISLLELANGIAVKRGITKKDAEIFVRALFDVVCDSLRNDKIVKIKGFGTFKLVMMESRESINVNNGERILIKGYTKVSFTPDATLRDVINKPFAQFDTVLLYDGTKTEDMERIDEVVDEGVAVNEVKAEDVVEIAEVETVEVMEETIESPLVKEEETVVEEQTSVDEKDNGTIESPIKTSENIIQETVVNTPSENIQKETVVSEEVQKEPVVKKRSNMVIWLILILLLLIGVGRYIGRSHIAFLGNCCSDGSNENELPIQVVDTNEVAVNQIDTVKVDTLVQVVDSIVYPQVANGEFVIVGTKVEHILKNGETLRTVSLKYYGTKEYSEYIVVYNQIEAPDLVPVGMVIKIPELQSK